MKFTIQWVVRPHVVGFRQIPWLWIICSFKGIHVPCTGQVWLGYPMSIYTDEANVITEPCMLEMDTFKKDGNGQASVKPRFLYPHSKVTCMGGGKVAWYLPFLHSRTTPWYRVPLFMNCSIILSIIIIMICCTSPLENGDVATRVWWSFYCKDTTRNLHLQCINATQSCW